MVAVLNQEPKSFDPSQQSLKVGLQMNQAFCELFEARLSKYSFKFDSGTKQTEPEPQF